MTNAIILLGLGYLIFKDQIDAALFPDRTEPAAASAASPSQPAPTAGVPPTAGTTPVPVPRVPYRTAGPTGGPTTQYPIQPQYPSGGGGVIGPGGCLMEPCGPETGQTRQYPEWPIY